MSKVTQVEKKSHIELGDQKLADPGYGEGGQVMVEVKTRSLEWASSADSSMDPHRLMRA